MLGRKKGAGPTWPAPSFSRYETSGAYSARPTGTLIAITRLPAVSSSEVVHSVLSFCATFRRDHGDQEQTTGRLQEYSIVTVICKAA